MIHGVKRRDQPPSLRSEGDECDESGSESSCLSCTPILVGLCIGAGLFMLRSAPEHCCGIMQHQRRAPLGHAMLKRLPLYPGSCAADHGMCSCNATDGNWASQLRMRAAFRLRTAISHTFGWADWFRPAQASPFMQHARELPPLTPPRSQGSAAYGGINPVQSPPPNFGFARFGYASLSASCSTPGVTAPARRSHRSMSEASQDAFCSRLKGAGARSGGRTMLVSLIDSF